MGDPEVKESLAFLADLRSGILSSLAGMENFLFACLFLFLFFSSLFFFHSVLNLIHLILKTPK